MAYRFLLDANLPRSAADAVRESGHVVEFARDVGLGSAPDAAIAARARATHATLVTRDLDFADVRQYPPEEYDGLVVLRLPDDSVSSDIAAAVRRFVSTEKFLRHLRGRLVIVERGPGSLPAAATRMNWLGTVNDSRPADRRCEQSGQSARSVYFSTGRPFSTQAAMSPSRCDSRV